MKFYIAYASAHTASGINKLDWRTASTLIQSGKSLVVCMAKNMSAMTWAALKSLLCKVEQFRHCSTVALFDWRLITTQRLS